MSNAQPSTERPALPVQSDFQHVRQDVLRLSDLDFQKHVNNATTTALFANARFEFLHATVRTVLPPEGKLFIARLEVDFTGEMHYGEPVFIGTRILGCGRTSMRLEQAIFQGGRCAARSVSVFVRIGEGGKPAPWPEAVRQFAVS